MAYCNHQTCFAENEGNRRSRKRLALQTWFHSFFVPDSLKWAYGPRKEMCKVSLTWRVKRICGNQLLVIYLLSLDGRVGHISSGFQCFCAVTFDQLVTVSPSASSGMPTYSADCKIHCDLTNMCCGKTEFCCCCFSLSTGTVIVGLLSIVSRTRSVNWCSYPHVRCFPIFKKINIFQSCSEQPPPCS
jgi:hypothetical protein